MDKAFFLILTLFSLPIWASTVDKTFDTHALKGLNIVNTSGDVRITVSTDDKVHVSARKTKFPDKCQLKMERVKDCIEIQVEKEGWFHNKECEVNFHVQVPKAVALNIKSGSGNLTINGTKGPVDFVLGSGQTVIDAEVENLDAQSGSGSIDVKGLSGSAKVRTGSGDVTLTYKSALAKGSLDIETGSGDATVYLPKAMKVVTDFASGSGKIHNELDRTEEFKVSMKAGSGDLKLKKTK